MFLIINFVVTGVSARTLSKIEVSAEELNDLDTLEYCAKDFEFDWKYNRCQPIPIDSQTKCVALGHEWSVEKKTCVGPQAYCGKGSIMDDGRCLLPGEYKAKTANDIGSKCKMTMDYIKSIIPSGDKVITTCTLKERCVKITIAGSRTTHNEYTCGADQNGNCPTYASCKSVNNSLRMQQTNQETYKPGSNQIQRAIGE